MFQKTKVIFGFAAISMLIAMFTVSCGRSSEKETTPQTAGPAATNPIISSKLPPSTTTITNIPIYGAGALQFTLPPGWIPMYHAATSNGVPTTILFSNPEGSNFAMDFTVLFDPENRLKLDARAALEKALNNVRPSALETNPAVHDLVGPEFSGHYFSITDKELVDRMPSPGQFKYMTRGNAKFSQLVASFKIFSNSPSGEDRKEALEMIRNVRLVHP